MKGPDFRAPFDPDPPQPQTSDINPGRVEQAGTSAATEFSANLLAVLDHVDRAPIVGLKSGGVGAREIAKLAKTCGVDEASVRMTLETAAELGLLRESDGRIVASPVFAEWRALEPGAQLAAVLRVWFSLGAHPTQAHSVDGKALRALARSEGCAGCAFARIGLLRVLSDFPPGVAVERRRVLGPVIWLHPFTHVASIDADDPLATPWREAELLGVVALDALTPLGRALLADAEPGNDVDAVRQDADPARTLDGADPLAAAAGAALPGVAEHASFGSDLTAYVVGAASAFVTRTLDSAADRESGGVAITWRFSPTTVRRALDEGCSGDVLLDALTEIAGVELPQPLRYLVSDVARRHGHLRLSAASSVVRSDDAALLAEVAADRKLAKLGLRLLAPTVLACDVSLDVLLATLRGAGYLPVVDSDVPAARAPSVPGSAAIDRRHISAVPSAAPSGARERPGGRRPELRVVPDPTGAGPDPSSVATALLSRAAERTPTSDAIAELTETEQALLRLPSRLSVVEIRQLANAIDARGRVRIEYRAQSGALTERVIADLELAGPTLFAWCELRSDDRFFTVSRIVSVAAL